MRWIAAGSSMQLRRATEEALALSVWLKRFADASEKEKARKGANADANPCATDDGSESVSGGANTQADK
jgi:hypothetical protein